MDGVLLTPLEMAPADADLAALVTRLLAEVDQLRAAVTGLRRENLELRQQAGYWQSRHADAVRRLAALEQENEQLRGENRKLQAARLGVGGGAGRAAQPCQPGRGPGPGQHRCPD